MNEELNIEWSIIIDKLNNTISDSDLEVFNNWISSDKQNQIFFDSLIALKKNEFHFERYEEIDIDKAWKQVDEKTKRVKKGETIVMRILKYAAVFLLGIFTLFSFYQISNSKIAVKDAAYHTIKAPNGAKADIVLADGTHVILNSGSELIYPEFFVAEKREVKLTGEAYFDVERDEKRPFFIETKDIKIRVLGTSFNVKAYPEDETIETFVESGKVEVELTNVHVQQKKIYLTQNEKAVFTKGTAQVQVQTGKDGGEAEKMEKIDLPKQKPQLLISGNNDSEEELAWKNDKFIFKNEPLERLIIKLERWYGVEIELNRKGLAEYHFTGTFERETIEQVMNVIAYSIPIQWKKDHKKILIFSKD